MLTPMVAAAEAVIDTSLVTELVNLVTSVCGLFKIFPLNVFLIGGLVFLGFRIFKSAKSAAKQYGKAVCQVEKSAWYFFTQKKVRYLWIKK